MTKFNYNGEVIEFSDELEKGFVELDMLTEYEDKTEDLEGVAKKAIDLDDTVEFNVGDINETE